MRTYLILLLCIPCIVSAEYTPTTVEMALERASEHVYFAQGAAGIATYNEGFISNASAIVTSEGLVIVDALGSPSLAERFLDLLRGITDKPVIKVIVTHYHADHIYGLQVFKDLGAEIVAPGGHQNYLDSPSSAERLQERRISLYPWVDESTHLVRPDRVITEDTTIVIGDVTLELSYLGEAHSDGDLTVTVKPDQVLISGDIIFEGRIPFTGSADTRRWQTVLEGLGQQGIKSLIPGHGPAASDPEEAVRATLHYLRYTREKMAEAVDEMTPFAEAYDASDWSEFSNLPAFEATHRRNAYGIYLSLEQESLNSD